VPLCLCVKTSPLGDRAMKKKTKICKYKVPSFDEAVLEPNDDEFVRVYRTRPNQEFAFEKLCRENGIHCYLPVRRAVSVHNVIQKGTPYSYSKEVLRPMFPPYLFIKVSTSDVQAIHNFRISARCVPLKYSQEKLLNEIRTVRIVETIGFEQELEVHQEIPEGGHFLITSGIWTGVKGHLVSKNGVDLWTVEIDFCQQAVTTSIDPKQYRMIPVED